MIRFRMFVVIWNYDIAFEITTELAKRAAHETPIISPHPLCSHLATSILDGDIMRSSDELN